MNVGVRYGQVAPGMDLHSELLEGLVTKGVLRACSDVDVEAY